MMSGSHKLRTSTASVRLGTTKNPTGSDSDKRCKDEETNGLKIKKKVRFNANVEIFEYNPDDEDDDDDIGCQKAGDKGTSEIAEMEAKKLLACHLTSDRVSTAPTSGVRTNCRYNSIREGNGEEAETHNNDLGVHACDVSETAFLMQSAEDSIQNPALSHTSPTQDLKAVKLNGKRLYRNPSVMKPIKNPSQWKAFLMQSAEDSTENPTPFHPSPCQQLKDVKFNKKRSNRSHDCANSVMKPIENLSQWKAVKAREEAQFLLQTERDSTAPNPSNCRYNNCRDNYGLRDEIQRKCGTKSTTTASSLNAEGSLVRLYHLPNDEPKAEKLNLNVRYRRQYLNSVLNPIENLSQWKAAIATSKFKHPGKENMAIQ